MSIDDSFMSFHMLCDQIQSDSSLTIKKDIIRTFVSRYSGDLGLLFKLLLPKYNGRLYHLQDKQLIKLLALALGQTETTLKNHLNSSGCIGLTAANFFKPRVPPLGMCQLNAKGMCTLTLPQLDGHLEALSLASGEAQQLNVIQKFLNVTCKNALFTFLRSVKQDLHLGAGVRVVLEGLHPSANAVYKRCANVQEVVKRVQAGTVDAADDDGFDTVSNQSRGVSPAAGGVKKGHVEASITMFMPLAPMLASPSSGVDHVLLKTPNGAYSETKYDGERIQIHKNGTSFKFFARSLKPMKADKYEGLEKYLVEAVKAQSCILDGEILLVDIATSKPLPFGTLGKHKKTQFATACTCIFLFDIMYKDGKTLLDVPMDARREYLKSSIQFIQNRVMISEMRVVQGPPQERRATMQKHLQFAVAEGLEGLVIKDMKSLYEPGSRHWIKLKKDYLQGMADSADLIVLGAWYGSGNKGGVLSTFLMGVWDKTAVGPYKQFKTVVKVGNGHDDMTLTKLNTYFKNSGRMIPGGPGVAPPQWLDINTSHYPDVYIKPMPSADVWEISAAEFSQTKTHTANGVSMRFPRVTKIRDDKDLNTATSLQELVNLMQISLVKGSKLDALGAHQAVNSDDEDNEGAHERGVMMRTSSRYDGPTAVVPGQHFGPLSTAVVEQLKKEGGHVSHSSAILDTALHFGTGMPAAHQQQLAQFMQQPQPNPSVVPAQLSNTPLVVADTPLPLRQTPYWVFRSSGFKGDTPPPMPTADEPDAPLTGSIEYVQGDVAQPRNSAANPHQHLLLIHCCAVGPGMKWSQRGTMGTLGKFIGDEPEESYARYMATGEAKVGDAILVECSNILNKGRLFVATILGQKGGQGGIPQVDQDAFEKALLVHLLPFAKAHLCSVHIPKLDRGIGINWGLIDKVLRYTYSRQHNLRVVVYQKGAVAGDGMARQDTTLPSSLNRQLTAALPPPQSAASTLMHREETAAPSMSMEERPAGFIRVATLAPVPIQPPPTGENGVEEQFGVADGPGQLATGAGGLKLLASVRACLFTVEGCEGSPVEPTGSKALRDQLKGLGASVLPHSTFSDDEKSLIFAAATHLILPLGFKASDSADAAEALLALMCDMRSEGAKAVVVRAEWVSACQANGQLLSTEGFGLSRKGPIVPSCPPVPAALPLAGKFVVVIGGRDVNEQRALVAMAQDLGAVVQEKLRMSDGVGAMGQMIIARTGVSVSVPIGKTTHVLVKPVASTESAPTDSFREGSASVGVGIVPLRTSNTTVHMQSPAEVEAINKALSVGANVLTSGWLDDCLLRSKAGAGLPRDGDYFVDNAVLYSADSVQKATAAVPLRANSVLNTKRPREELTPVASMPPTPIAKMAPVHHEPAAVVPYSTKAPPLLLGLPKVGDQCTKLPLGSVATTSAAAAPVAHTAFPYERLPPFLLPGSGLVISLHGFSASDSAALLQQVGSLKNALGASRSISVEGNLNLLGLKGTSGGGDCQRVLICEVLTSTSLPLFKGVAASCQRAVREPATYTADYRTATIVSSAWLGACCETRSILPVEPYVVRPEVAFNAPYEAGAAQGGQRAATTPRRSSVVACVLPPTPPPQEVVTDVDDDNATDTESYCTVQDGASVQAGAETEEED